jgi:iron complex transport system substrate-binding protein
MRLTKVREDDHYGMREVIQVVRMVVGIAMTALCMSLIAMPVDASDFTLEIFGNANMDDTIDELDIEYVRGIIDGVNEPMRFADANYDGVIDEEDIAQIYKIIEYEDREITLLDIKGRVVTMAKPVERVIVLQANFGELIKAIGSEDMIVAVCDDTLMQQKLLPDLSALPSLGKSKEPDMELLIELEPDIVFSNEYTDPDLIKNIESAGITVVCLSAHGSLTATRMALKNLGYILEETDKVNELLNWQNSYLDLISERINTVAYDEKPRVLYSWSLANVIGTSGGDCPVKDLIEYAGGIDIAAELPGEYIEVDPEWVIVQNPSLILKEGMGWYTEASYEINDPSRAQELIEEFSKSTIFESIDAVREEKVFVLSTSLISTNQCWIGLIYMAKLFHPSLFEDIDPRAINQEYLNKFLRIDLNLSEEGVLLYPVPDGW